MWLVNTLGKSSHKIWASYRKASRFKGLESITCPEFASCSNNKTWTEHLFKHILSRADESCYPLGRDDFRFFWNFITASQILPCVIETRRYGYIRDSGSRVETPHRATIGCEKFYNGCFHCCGHFWDKYTSALVHNFVCYQNSEIWLYTGLWK